MGFFDKEEWMYDSPEEAYGAGAEEGLSSGVGNKMAHDMGFKDGQAEAIKAIRADFATEFNGGKFDDDDDEDND